MRINSLSINNFLHVRHFDSVLSDRISLFAGPNESGKTSIAQAIRFALGGDPGRVAMKKDYRQLVSDGAKGGWVEISVSSDEMRLRHTLLRAVETGNYAGSTAETTEAMACCLEPHTFIELTPADRRRFLVNLMGVRVSPAAIGELLAARGVSQANIDAVTPLLRSGWDAAENEAKGKARELKGGWRAVTGEDWGADKGERWQSVVQIDPLGIPAREEAELVLDTEQAKLDDLLRKQGAEIEAQRAKQVPQRQQQGRPIATQKKLFCPECRSALMLDANGSLAPYVEHDHAPNPQPQPEPKRQAAPTGNSVIDQAIARARVDVQTATSELRRIDDLERAHAESLTKTSKAAAIHASIGEWLALAKLLAPDGLQAELLAATIDPLNKALAKCSRWTRAVQISGTMDITYGGRPYALCSESAQWRINAVVAVAIAGLSGVGVVILDRFDCLDVPSRTAALQWLIAESESCQVVLLGTLKQAPRGLPDSIAVHWLGEKPVEKQEAVA